MAQTFHPLSQNDLLDLEAKRKWVREHYAPDAQDKYSTLKGKLALIDAILANNWVEPTETLKLQCLGITFGDALSQELGLEWHMVEDEYGRDPALTLPGTSIAVFPQTSISKRVEAGERVDVFALFKSACESIRGLRRSGA